MSLYNMLFGRNSQSGLLLAVVGLKEDEDYYKHCLEEFSEEFPVSMKKFQENCERNRGKR